MDPAAAITVGERFGDVLESVMRREEGGETPEIVEEQLSWEQMLFLSLNVCQVGVEGRGFLALLCCGQKAGIALESNACSKMN